MRLSRPVLCTAAAVLSSSLLLGGCGGSGSDSESGSASDDQSSAQAKDKPSYHDDLSEILTSDVKLNDADADLASQLFVARELITDLLGPTITVPTLESAARQFVGKYQLGAMTSDKDRLATLLLASEGGFDDLRQKTGPDFAENKAVLDPMFDMMHPNPKNNLNWKNLVTKRITEAVSQAKAVSTSAKDPDLRQAGVENEKALTQMLTEFQAT